MAAFTAPGSFYPEYANLEVHDGKLRIIVRSPGREAYGVAGSQGQMSMPLAEAELMLSEALLDVRLARQHG